ncbi:hypothetical protein GQ55_5G285900 [Panicum hallii var. hallii]|uniref:Uncharacterized protein n=1 Tax=Panicum hallii var. hallii TaxID=1504633 RepID=A0A2T7DL65_9POAL|nr:hypothetical protein GQ55_5G285900 [Panicum hallii var. hallii]
MALPPRGAGLGRQRPAGAHLVKAVISGRGSIIHTTVFAWCMDINSIQLTTPNHLILKMGI